MQVGTVREIKEHEYRVGLTPESVRELVAHGHKVLVQSGAGNGIGAHDEDYASAGADIAADAASVFASCDLIVKVKEPQPSELVQLRKGQALFAYLHLAPDPQQAAGLLKSGATAIAYETVTAETGGLPLLKPMSQVAGRMCIQAGATALEKAHGGRGVLLGGVPGVMPACVAVIGGGVVGFNAAQMAAGLGADVTILDKNLDVLEQLAAHFKGRVKTRFANRANIADSVSSSDLVIGAVLIPGAAAPKLVSRHMLTTMKRGAVLVDVAIDQGGCFESSRPTTLGSPTFVEEGVVHYCVSNMPGAVARTSAYALNNVTLPHVVRMADLGWKEAMRRDPHLANGLNVHDGRVVCAPVAQEQGYEAWPLAKALAD